MAYVGSVNNVVTVGTADYFNAIKTALLAAGWELMASSDGTTYTAGSSPDRLPDVAAWNNSGAWCRLREPGGVGGREYCFMRGSTATTAIIKYSRATGFVGGSPGATTLPTTGASGDGAVWVANASLGFGSESSITAPTSGAAFATTSGYVSCVASDTAVNGVYGWWMNRWAVGGTPGDLTYTEAVQAGTYPTQDTDPSYRYSGSTSTFFAANTNRFVQYWQAYDFTAPTSPYRTYITNGAYGIYWSWYSNGSTVILTPRPALGLGPYGVGVQTYPMMVGNSTLYSKGMTTGVCCYSVTLNNCDTLNLTSAEPKIVIVAAYGFAMPWVPSVLPIY